MSTEPGVLYVVATPIGNLEDLSPRAARVLSEVDRIAAEDTRHSGRLLSHFGINRPLWSLHEHNERDRCAAILDELLAGRSVALISDAGTPLVSDPGFHLVREARAKGLRIVPVPGPSSLLAALSVAGLPTDRFVFEGFLPAKEAARRTRLQDLGRETRTLVFFESGHRLRDCLASMVSVFGPDRQGVIARELTKLHEQVHGDRLVDLGAWLNADPNRLRGEFVVLVTGAPPPTADDPGPEARRLLGVLLDELPAARAAAIAARLTGFKKNNLYSLALTLKK